MEHSGASEARKTPAAFALVCGTLILGEANLHVKSATLRLHVERKPKLAT